MRDRSPTEHRAIVAEIMAKLPANDCYVPLHLAWPTMERLARSAPGKARLLASWAELMKPASFPSSLDAANDNADLDHEGWERAFWAEPDDWRPPMNGNFKNDEIRPTILETLAAAGRVSVVRTRGLDSGWGEGRRHGYRIGVQQHRALSGGTPSRVSASRKHLPGGGWSAMVKHVIRVEHCLTPVLSSASADLGQLHFLSGRLERYAMGDGHARKPRAAPKRHGGGKRSRAGVMSYLALEGVPWPEQWRTHDGGRWVEPTERAGAARAALKALGVDGDVPLDRAAIEARRVHRGPTEIAHGAQFLGGVVASVNRANGQAAAAGDELDRAARRNRLRTMAGPVGSEILDLAASPMSARDIGEHFGRHGKYAERWAVREIDLALEKIAA